MQDFTAMSKAEVVETWNKKAGDHAIAEGRARSGLFVAVHRSLSSLWRRRALALAALPDGTASDDLIRRVSNAVTRGDTTGLELPEATDTP